MSNRINAQVNIPTPEDRSIPCNLNPVTRKQLHKLIDKYQAPAAVLVEMHKRLNTYPDGSLDMFKKNMSKLIDVLIKQDTLKEFNKEENA